MTKIMMTAALGLMMSGAAIAQDEQPAGEPSAADPIMKVDTSVFFEQAMSSNQFEIRSSEMAAEKAEAADIKEFATKMVADHTKAGEQLQAAAETSDAAAPAAPEPAPKHAAMLKLLEGAEGPDFDALYLDMQAGAHREAVSLFRTYAGSGDDDAVVAFAEKTLPTLKAQGACQGTGRFQIE